MTRFWPGGLPIEVEMDALWTPQRFTWGMTVHPVERVVDRWRVDEAWWRERIWREYFRLTTHTGLLVEVFHDLTGDEWYLQRVYD